MLPKKWTFRLFSLYLTTEMLYCNYLFQIQIGNAHYDCPCNVRYLSSSVWLTVGLSVGCGLLFIAIIIVIVRVVIVCRRRNNNKLEREERRERNARNDYVQGRQRSNTDVFELDDCNYWAIPADSAEMPQKNNSVYCSAHPDEPEANKEYAVLGEPKPQPQQGQPQSLPEPQPSTSNSPYYLSLKDDNE